MTTSIAQLRALLAGLLLIGCAPAEAAAPVSASALAREYLRAFNDGRPGVYRSFVQTHGPAGEASPKSFWLAWDVGRAESGGYDLVRVERAGPTAVSEILKARLADDYVRLELQADGSAKRRIGRLTLAPAERPSDVAPPTRLPFSRLWPAIDARLKAMGDFSGVVMVAVDGRPVFVRAGGLADRARGLPNTRQTRFRMASMGKMFTAVGIMQLVQAGRLDLDRPVGVYLKDYPNAEVAAHVTVRQLLTHTGGTGDFMSKKWADNYQRLNTPADYVAMFGPDPLEFPPGSKFGYSNYGFVVLGRIIEAVSGEPYEAYVRRHLFDPAGMGSTGLNEPPVRFSELARRYMHLASGYEPPPAPFSGAALPAGGAYSTVDDMLGFAGALTTHKLLDVANTELATTPKVKGDDDFYGLGFQIRNFVGLRDYGHDGGGPGENSCFHIVDDGRVVVVAFTNVAPTWRANKLCDFIVARLPAS